jgi:hypothetical protein
MGSAVSMYLSSLGSPSSGIASLSYLVSPAFCLPGCNPHVGEATRRELARGRQSRMNWGHFPSWMRADPNFEKPGTDRMRTGGLL